MSLESLDDLSMRLLGGDDGRGGGEGPVVVLLHGYGAPADDLVPLGRALGLPKAVRFVFPAAPLKLEMWPMMDSRAWWHIDMQAYETAMQTGQLRDLSKTRPEGQAEANAQVNALLDKIEAELGIGTDRMVLGGFSQGAMLSCDVVLRSKRAFAGLAMLSGTLLCESEWIPLMAARASLPIFQSHGYHDPLLPFSLAERLRDSFRQAGAEVDWLPFSGAHEIPADVLMGLGRFIGQCLDIKS